jgi:hypothetical protein
MGQRSQAQQPTAIDDFGRWETRLQHCRMGQAAAAGSSGGPRGCQYLRLEQQMQGLMSVRFIAASGGTTPSSSELVFAGVVAPGSGAMQCRQGRCEPSWPVRLLVHATAHAGIDPRGVALGIPRARMARGRCLLQKGSVSCRAGETGQAPWEASGRW